MWVTDLVVDGSGATIVTGRVEGDVDLGTGSAPQYGALLVKLDADARLAWTKVFSGFGGDVGAVAAGPFNGRGTFQGAPDVLENGAYVYAFRP